MTSSGVTPPVAVQVLGSCEVLVGSGADTMPVELTALQRRLLTRLAMAAPREATTEQLLDALWHPDQPRTARAALHNQVSRVRSLVGNDAIVTTPLGYALVARVDAVALSEEVAAAERALHQGDAAQAWDRADAALGRWRSRPLPELDHLPDTAPHRRRLEELRAGAENVRLASALRTGAVAWAVPEAERLVAEAPYDERRWAMLVGALDLAGRRGDALGAFDRARRTLRDGLGLEPGPLLRAAEVAVLGIDVSEHERSGRRLVGRAEQVGLASAACERGASVVVTGESGSGRSSLLDEVAVRARRAGAVVSQVRCVAYPATATVPLVELLGPLGEDLDRVLAPVDAFVEAVRRATGGRRVVLVVDDLDLAGPTTRRAVAACRALDGVSVLCSVGADHVDDEDLGPASDQDDVSVVELPPLDRAAVVELTRDLFEGRGEPRDELVDWLATLSGGNPMFLECLLADPAVGEQWVDGRPPPDLPGRSALGDVVRRRLERLGTTTRAAVEVAAVCGPEVPTVLLEELAPPTGVAAAMASGLLVSSADGSTRFRHGAVQRVVYADVSPGRRMEVHHTAALALREVGAPAAVVARHHLAAVELDPMAATVIGRAAAVEAANQGAHRDAARWYERSIGAARSMGAAGTREMIVSLIGLGDALRLAGDRDHEAVLFEAADLATAIDAHDLIGDAAYALLQLGSTTESGALHERAVDLADRALAIVEEPEQRAVIAAAASLAHSMSGHPERCRSLFARAEGEARSDDVRRKVLPFAYLGLGLPGDLDDRERLGHELRDRGEEADDPVALFEAHHLLFSTGLQRADGAGVRRSLAVMEALFERVGDVGRQWALGYQRAAVAHLDDDLDRSEELSAEALDRFAPVSPSRAFAVYGGQLLVVRLAQGRLSELTATMEALVAEQPAVPAWHAALALAIAHDDPERSCRHAAAALDDVPRDFTWLAAHVIGGRAAALAGDDGTRAEYARRLAPWAGLVCWQGTCAYGPVDTTLAALALARGDAAGADRHAAVARGLARTLGAPVFTREIEALVR